MATFTASFLAAIISSQYALTTPSEESFGFAASLLAEQDRYRAITELKRFAFLTKGKQALHVDLLIGQLYSETEAVDASRFHFSRVLENSQGPAATMAQLLNLQNVCVTRLLTGNCEEEINQLPEDAPLHLKDWYKRYWALFMGAKLEPAPHFETDAVWGPYEKKLQAFAVEQTHLTVKNPAVAGILSAVLPGAGQVYNGRYLDAGIAFTLTGLSTWGTWYLLARQNPEWGLGIPLGLMALTFYSGNIVNAVGDAFKLNENAQRDFAKRMQKQLWPHLAVSVGPRAESVVLVMQLGKDAPAPILESR